MSASQTFVEEIPPSAVIRQRLAEAATKTYLLRQQLKVSLRQEREAERLARLAEGSQPLRPEGRHGA